MCTFFVPGTPAPQGSKRHVGGGRMVESSPDVEPWRAVVGWHALRTHLYVESGPVSVSVVFALKRPQKLPKGRTLPSTRPDGDKLARAVLDALTGTCYRDDGQVVDLTVRKRYADAGSPTGATITVEAM